MTIKKSIEPYVKALYEAGADFDAGCAPSDVADVVQKLRQHSFKPYCVVASWSWWDIQASPAVLEPIRARKLKPTIVYAGNVIEDEQQRFPPGGFVRTSWLVKFYDDCIFETSNTIYILQGPGTRKAVEYDIAFSIHG